MMNLAAASIVVLCLFAIRVAPVGTDISFYHLETLSYYTRIILAVTHATAYLLYPLLGLLSDVYFTRYKVIRLAFIIMILAACDCFLVFLAIVSDLSLVHGIIEIIVLVMATPGVLLILLSLGLFEANAIVWISYWKAHQIS